MKTSAILFSILLFVGTSLYGCNSGDNASAGEALKTSRKGGVRAMQTYYMGRFALDVPVEMKQAVQAQTIRYAELETFEWPHGVEREAARLNMWKTRIHEIKHLKKPHKVASVVLQEKTFTDVGAWAKGILYHGDYIIPERHFWTVLVDYGKYGLWLTLDGVNDEKTFANGSNILRHYKETTPQSSRAFHLGDGLIDLPYLEQERTYARFEAQSLNVKLEIEMKETHEVEELGMAERLAAAIATRYAPGVDVDKIRSRSRTAAGLKGEELVMRMSARDEDTQLNFSWEFRGEIDSGERPEILITMEAPDGDLDARLKVWDQILDSFKPMYR